MTDRGNGWETTTREARPSRSPPLFQLFTQLLADPQNGIVSIVAGPVHATATVVDSRVVALSHPDASPEAVIALLQRTGLVSDSDVGRAGRRARKRQMTLEDAVVGLGVVSGGTLANAREMLCREVLIDLLLDADAEVTAHWSLLRGTRENCALPLPFLLREAQRRFADMPAVRAAVPSYEQVFGKVSAVMGTAGSERWEDLKMNLSERQVYFFLDGRRTVSEVALATCQPEFHVARAIRALIEAGLVRRVAAGGAASATARVSQSAVRRVLALTGAVVLLLTLVGGGTLLNVERASPSPNAPPPSDPFRTVVSTAASMRLGGAVRLYELVLGVRPGSFEDLLRERMVLREDARAAAMFPIGNGFLLKDAGAAAPPARRTEDDGQEQR